MMYPLQTFLSFILQSKMRKRKVGGEGHRSPYLSHAKRALYHLSYTPNSTFHPYRKLFIVHPHFTFVRNKPFEHATIICWRELPFIRKQSRLKSQRWKYRFTEFKQLHINSLTQLYHLSGKTKRNWHLGLHWWKYETVNKRASKASESDTVIIHTLRIIHKIRTNN